MSCINMYLIMETKGPVSLMPPAKNININHDRGRAIVIRTSSNTVRRESSMVSWLCVVALFVMSTRFLPSTSVMPVAAVMSLNAKETRMRRLDNVKIRRETRFFCKSTKDRHWVSLPKREEKEGLDHRHHHHQSYCWVCHGRKLNGTAGGVDHTCENHLY